MIVNGLPQKDLLLSLQILNKLSRLVPKKDFLHYVSQRWALAAQDSCGTPFIIRNLLRKSPVTLSSNSPTAIS